MATYIIIGITAVISYICFTNQGLFDKLAFSPYRTVKNGEWHRLITHGFVHADTTHLLVNMLTLWSFGVYIEQGFQYLGLGLGGYLGLYFGGMVAASVYDLIKHKDDYYYRSVGASGAISAVLFTSIFFNPFGKILLFAIIPIPGILFGPLYLIYCQYMNKRGGGNINHNAHFYGAVYGIIYPILLEPGLIQVFLSNF
ncbi:rhomboid family intramembrane serine protease [Bacteroides sedimenti]|uniref:Rhomboid family intramembrane serine protease n=1 Tax=Bacteroides sedimenti TaxID=2136147 RepID=A0ABM8IAL1_9BACE